MDPYAKFMRRWFPKAYAKQGFQRAKRAYQKELTAALTWEKRAELKRQLDTDLEEWGDWITEIEDAELVAQAAKMDIHLGDMPYNYSEDVRQQGHYEIRTFGNQILIRETRAMLRTKMQERGPAYRKEKRETVELYIKILTVLTGLGGVAIGLLAVMNK